MLSCRLVLFRGERLGDRGALLAHIALGGVVDLIVAAAAPSCLLVGVIQKPW